MGVAARVTRLPRQLVAASHELTQGINERRFLSRLVLGTLLSRDTHLSACATPADRLLQLVEAAHRCALQPSVYVPAWKSLPASPVAKNSIRQPEQGARYRHVRAHGSPRWIVRSRPANPGY
jgi:hypothetical protein